MPCREIITLQLGQCGNSVGCSFWEILTKEHDIDVTTGNFKATDERLIRIDAFFCETINGTFTPRAKLIDLDGYTLDVIRNKIIGTVFDPQDFICAQHTSGNNYAQVLFEGFGFALDCLDSIRNSVEACDCFHGIQYINALGGGCGSAMSSVLSQSLENIYPKSTSLSHASLPSLEVSDSTLAPFNVIMGLSSVLTFVDQCLLYDNQHLIELCQRFMRVEKPSYADLNYAMTFVTSGVTACMRFSSSMNTDLRKMAVNLIPFPRLRFYVSSFSPMMLQKGLSKHHYTVNNLVFDAFDTRKSMIHFDPPEGQFLACNLMFRGELGSNVALERCREFQRANDSLFVDWVPFCVKMCVTEMPHFGTQKSLVHVSNHTSIGEALQKQTVPFQLMLNKGAFVHTFAQYHLTDVTMNEAYFNIEDLIHMYHDHGSKGTKG